MNTREIFELDDIDEVELARLVGDYVRRFRRLPSAQDIRRHEEAALVRRRPAVAMPRQRPSVGVTMEPVTASP